MYICIYIGSEEKLKRGKSGEKGENRGKRGENEVRNDNKRRDKSDI